MNVTQTVYFMSLVGGMAGLSCWVVTTLFSDMNLPWPAWALDTISPTIMGGLIGSMTVGFADRWTADRVVGRWASTGFVLGAIAGIVTGIASIPVQRLAASHPTDLSSAVGRIAGWTIAGGLIGLVTGLRWWSVNRYRPLHALLGGLLGGVGGGMVYALLARRDPFFAALAYILIGVGITSGVTLAPVLLRDGVLQFIRSGDPRAHRKYASPRQEWVIQRGDRFAIGNQSADMSMTIYSRDVQIFIPDEMIAPRHAILFERDKHFYIEPHPESLNWQKQGPANLQVGGATVSRSRELLHGDELVIGQTVLRFCTRKRRSEEALEEA